MVQYTKRRQTKMTAVKKRESARIKRPTREYKGAKREQGKRSERKQGKRGE